MSKTRPILFSGEMVRAILENRKSQTRRVIKRNGRGYDSRWKVQAHPGGGWWATDGEHAALSKSGFKCPYGVPGDKLWVRETFFHDGTDDAGNLHYRASATQADEDWFKEEGWKWKPSIHMPREFSRITLEVTDIRVERVQDISEDDAKAEGVNKEFEVDLATFRDMTTDIAQLSTYRLGFAHLWDSINKKRGYSYDSNCWIWVVEFKVTND